jgi:predicted glycosyltransferase
VGHFVRSRELCRSLARRGEVLFVSGGVPVPGPSLGRDVRLLPLPPLRRDRTTGQLLPADGTQSYSAVRNSRRVQLNQAVADWIPDAVVMEHFPVSKWELADEILGWMATIRQTNPQVVACCSLRDFPATNELLQADSRSHDWIIDTLEHQFDAVLVHSDPAVSELHDDCPWAKRLTIPIIHTGYVVEEPAAGVRSSVPAVEDPHAPVLVSAGGLDDGDRLAELSIAAWEILHERGQTKGRRLVVLAPFQLPQSRLDRLAARLTGLPAELSPFRDDFLNQIWNCALSISQGGYNTTMNILRSGCRGIVAPNPRMHDQVVRTELLARRGLLSRLDVEHATAADLARLIMDQLSRPRPCHSLMLDGAERTTDWLCERLARPSPGLGGLT